MSGSYMTMRQAVVSICVLLIVTVTGTALFLGSLVLMFAFTPPRFMFIVAMFILVIFYGIVRLVIPFVGHFTTRIMSDKDGANLPILTYRQAIFTAVLGCILVIIISMFSLPVFGPLMERAIEVNRSRYPLHSQTKTLKDQ